MKKITLIISSVAVATFSSAQTLPIFNPALGVYQAAGWNFTGGFSYIDVNDYADDLFTPAAVNASFDTTGLVQVSGSFAVGLNQVQLNDTGGNKSNLGDLDYGFNLGNRDVGYLSFQGAVDSPNHPNKTFLINFENKWQSFNAEGTFTGLKLQFDLLGSSSWQLPQDVDISIDGGAFTDYTTLNPTGSWASNTFDLGAYDTADSISFLITLNTSDPAEFNSEQPGLAFDNVLFYSTGITVVPEPSALALLIPFLAFASLTTRRRR